jgi:uncharacterized repeat protein (TIGR03803 family)
MLYGTANGGPSGYAGVLFKVSKNGANYTVLHIFPSSGGDGTAPIWVSTEGPDGTLYGMAASGGSANHGTIFKIQKDGTGFTVLRNFMGGTADGDYPLAGLTWGRDGALYGVTSQGGDSGGGVIFRLGSAQVVQPRLLNPHWSAGAFSFQFLSQSGVVYQPQWKTSLAAPGWQSLSNLTGNGGVLAATHTNPSSPQGLYRVVVP